MAEGTYTGGVPRPQTVPQTFGNSLVKTLEAERRFGFQKKMIEDQMNYRRNKDAVQQANWDKEFDLKKSQAKTQTELLQAQIAKLNKEKEMQDVLYNEMVNHYAENEDYTRVIGQHTGNMIMEQENKRLYDEKLKHADRWFGVGKKGFSFKDTRELEKSKREMTGDDPFGPNVLHDVGSYLDTMVSGVGNKYEGVPEYQAQQDPAYTTREEMYNQAIQKGGMSPQLSNVILGQDIHTMNALNAMPREQMLMFLQSQIPTMLMGQSVQSPYGGQ